MRARVRGTNDALARGEVAADPVAAERVVAERDHVGARCQETIRQLAGDACAVGNVLAVDDAHVDVELLPQPGQPVLDRPATRGAEDVCEKKDPQFRTTAADLLTSTVTWLPASFV